VKSAIYKIMITMVGLLDRIHQRFFFKKKEWPVVSGQYYVGRKESPVAVCTLSSLDLMRKIGPREEIAILGKTFTENLGIEKMIRNITTNPSIRFLILCGKESPHRVGQSIAALKKHGVDVRGHIVESRGKLPLLKNVTRDAINHFRQQIEIIDLIGEEQIDAVLARVAAARERNPGAFTGLPTPADSGGKKAVENITCRHRESQDYQADPEGFFVIQIDAQAHEILAEHYSNEFELLRVLHGKNALEISSTIIRNGWVTTLQHAAYLGRELGKAELALKRGWLYEQNKELMES
jgi:tetrahydromethanopterin S-methyltransferase subunit A